MLSKMLLPMSKQQKYDMTYKPEVREWLYISRTAYTCSSCVSSQFNCFWWLQCGLFLICNVMWLQCGVVSCPPGGDVSSLYMLTVSLRQVHNSSVDSTRWKDSRANPLLKELTPSLEMLGTNKCNSKETNKQQNKKNEFKNISKLLFNYKKHDWRPCFS